LEQKKAHAALEVNRQLFYPRNSSHLFEQSQLNPQKGYQATRLGNSFKALNPSNEVR
jgi:hypothetical protein